MRILAAGFVLAIMSTVIACPASKPVAPVNDASDAQQQLDGVTITTSDCHEAQLHLQFFNCPEGDILDVGESYEQICNHVKQTHEFNMHESCAKDAKNVDDLRSRCGIRCDRSLGMKR